MVEVNWDELREIARGAMRRAYAPYSDFPVGAAALVDDGRIENTPSFQYGHAPHQQCNFPCWLLNQGMPYVWKASDMGTKHIYLCGNKFNWVVGW